jgi:hypothetical protein
VAREMLKFNKENYTNKPGDPEKLKIDTEERDFSHNCQ